MGPHVHMYRETKKRRDAEVIEYKKWIDLAADNGIPMLRSQVGGMLKLGPINLHNHGIKAVKYLLDKVLPYAEERNVQLGL